MATKTKKAPSRLSKGSGKATSKKATSKKATSKKGLVTAEANLPAEILNDIYENAGAGVSNDPDDTGTPFVYILQTNSPECENPAERVDGAMPGMITIRSPRKLWDGEDGIQFVPSALIKNEVEWIPRNQGGGFIARHPVDTPLLDKATRDAVTGKNILPNGHELIRTNYFFGHVLEENEDPFPSIIGLSSTGMQTSRDWVNLQRANRLDTPRGRITMPIYSHVYNLTTKHQTNAKGAWFGFVVKDIGPVTDLDVFRLAKDFHESVEAGSIQMAQEPGGEATEEENTDAF